MDQTPLTSANTPEPRFSRVAIWGAIWLLICVVAHVWNYTPPGWAFNQVLRSVLGNFLAGGLAALLLVVAFAAPVGVTALGWLATNEIRRSRGRVCGLGLALGEMVLFPLLALDAWWLWLCSQTGLKLVVGAVAALAADALLILWLWRRVQKPLPPLETAPVRPEDASSTSGSLSTQLWRVARRAALVAALDLLLLETLLQLSHDWRESTEELWTMALYSASLAAMVWAAWPLRRPRLTSFIRAGAVLTLFVGLSLIAAFYSWVLRPNLGLYREPAWVAQHPGFQRGLRQRIENNLWHKPAPDLNAAEEAAAEDTPESVLRRRYGLSNAESTASSGPAEQNQRTGQTAVGDEFAGIAAEEHFAGGDTNKHYWLIRSAAGANAATGGHRLLLVLPGGDGGPDFQPFIKRMTKNALPNGYLVAQLIPPKWDDAQFKQLVWPTERAPYAAARFTTEAFVVAVVQDVQRRYTVVSNGVFALAWSSGGPAAYAASLDARCQLAGTFVAMSVFKPGQLPELKTARGKSYYLLHSPQDFIPFRMAEEARDRLAANGARVRLETYEGGHGWHGDVFGMIRSGIKWLEEGQR